MNDVKISLSRLTIPSITPVAFLEVASTAGFTNVGLNLFNIYRECLTKDNNFFELIDSIAQTSLTLNIGMLHCGHCILGAMDRESLKKVLKAAEQCGAKYCVGIVDPTAKWDRVIEDYKILLTNALKLNIRVCVEYSLYSGLKNILQAFDFVKENSPEQNGILVDSLHVFRANDLKNITHIDPAYISILQLCDGPLKNPKSGQLQLEAQGNRLDIGDGDFALSDLLKLIDCSVPIEVECPNIAYRSMDPNQRAQNCFQKAALLIKKTRSEII